MLSKSLKYHSLLRARLVHPPRRNIAAVFGLDIKLVWTYYPPRIYIRKPFIALLTLCVCSAVIFPVPVTDYKGKKAKGSLSKNWSFGCDVFDRASRSSFRFVSDAAMMTIIKHRAPQYENLLQGDFFLSRSNLYLGKYI